MKRRQFIIYLISLLSIPFLPKNLSEPELPDPWRGCIGYWPLESDTIEDIRNWGVDRLDEETYTELFAQVKYDEIPRIYGINHVHI